MGREVNTMTICREHEASFWMDIHGELNQSEREVWEKHLTVCNACREEKAIASQLMDQIRVALTPPPLSDAALTAVVDGISGKYRKQEALFPVFKRQRLIWRAIFPAFAAACLLIAIGFFSLKAYFPDSGQMSGSVANLDETLQTEDLEIIENMELLTEFETLEQLVRIGEDQSSSPQEVDERIHG
jgi:hypothetical protein